MTQNEPIEMQAGPTSGFQLGKLTPKILIPLCAAIFVLLFLNVYSLRSYQGVEWDEGVYFATFKSVQHGFPLYSQSYLSQPPGFFVTIFPIYAAFGSTIESGRLAIYFYSLVGLLGIVWLGWELKSVLFSFIAMSALYSIAIYTIQIIIMHDNSVSCAFSALTLASVFRFRNTTRWRWLILSAVTAMTAIMIKADVSTLLPVLLIIASTTIENRKRIGYFIKACAIFGFTAVAALLAFTVPFGISYVFADVVQLRLQAATAYRADPGLVFSYLRGQPQLVALAALAAVLTVIVVLTKKEKRLPVLTLALWAASALVLMVIYHPLMGAHLVLLAFPVGIWFSFALYGVIELLAGPLSQLVVIFLKDTFPQYKDMSVPWLSAIVTVALVLAAIALLVDRRAIPPVIPQGPVLNASETVGFNLITTYTQPDDYIVDDDGLMLGLSNRYTPPALTDTSHVRIDSGNLTPDDFEASLVKFKPKLIITWTERLVHLRRFEDILQQHNYKLLVDLGSYRQAYLLQP